MEDPRKKLKRGVDVPFREMITWYHTYGCNNWRKHMGLPMLRECGYKKRRMK